MSPARDVARAIDALRRGWPVAVDDVLFLAVETADAEALAAFDGAAPADLLISGNRAATLKLTNQREALPTAPVLIRDVGTVREGAAIKRGDGSVAYVRNDVEPSRIGSTTGGAGTLKA